MPKDNSNESSTIEKLNHKRNLIVHGVQKAGDPLLETPILEKMSYESEEARKQDIHEIQLEINKVRLKYIKIIFKFVIGYLVIALIILMLKGWNFYGFDLSDKVIITLLSTTTANVIGIFLTATKWLYPKGS